MSASPEPSAPGPDENKAPGSTTSGSSSQKPGTHGPYFWQQLVNDKGQWRTDPVSHAQRKPAGEDLAVFRAGLDRRAGEVLPLFRYYATPTDGKSTVELEAEHAALALYGLHQQSTSHPMHKPGVSLGTALLGLRRSGRFSEEAVDRRVEAAANTTSVDALRYRLRGLVTQLRVVGQPLDYSRLVRDINRWHRPSSRQIVRRRWGLDYYAWHPAPDQKAPANGPSDGPSDGSD
ncbi:type I-E CRISPR-associated protein Cse2/CasB [Streptomyces sp. O3]